MSHWLDSAHAELEKTLSEGGADFVQIQLLHRRAGGEARLLPLAMERRVAVLVNRPFARGGLFDEVKGKPP